MKTLIAIPCMDQVPVPFCQSLALLRKTGECTLAMQAGSLIYTSRNDLAKRAIAMDADYVLWLDSDMNFPPDVLERMMDTLTKRDFDILTGLYFRRVPPYSPVLFSKLEIDGEKCTFGDVDKIPEGVFEVAACGFGCVLMKTDILFDLYGRHNNPFAPIGNNGEDIAFCWRARQLGFKIWCDPSIKFGHVGYSVVDDKFFMAFNS